MKNRLLVTLFASMSLVGWSQEIIVESYSDGHNSQGFSQVEGRWAESAGKSTAPGLQATKSYYNDADSNAATARFTPEIPADGTYEVFITYPVQGNASGVVYTVQHADGSHTENLTQFGRNAGSIPPADQWHSLGTFKFNAGSSGYVEISDPLTGERPMESEPNARIYADAVKFVPVGDTPVTAQAAPDSAPATTTPAAGLPSLPDASPAGQASALPSLPGAPDAAASDMPGLPAVQAAAADAMPALPEGTPASAAADLPALPDASTPSAASELPSLPDTASAMDAMPALPVSTPADVAQDLPSLPPATVAQATPMATPDLPSLAPVTPTPDRTLPSPADTPVAGLSTGLPGGALSALPPTPQPAVPASTLPAFPGAATPAGGIPGATPVAQTPAGTPAPEHYSITTYNPANLQWVYDYGSALNSARAQGKNVMVFFTAQGNRAGETYETQYFSHPGVRQALNNFVLVKVDFPNNTRLGYSLGVFGAGIIVVTDAAGNVISRITQMPPTPMDMLRQMVAQPQGETQSGDQATTVSAPGL